MARRSSTTTSTTLTFAQSRKTLAVPKAPSKCRCFATSHYVRPACTTAAFWTLWRCSISTVAVVIFIKTKWPEVQPIQLTVSERTALLSFLNTLTDPRVQNELPPFDRPLLQSERNVSATIFGTSMTSGALVSVRLMAEGPAFLGKPAFVIGVAGIEPFQPAFLLLDVAGNPAGSTINGLNCWLGLTPALAPIFAGLSLTPANLVLSIPNQPLLVGSTLYAQWVVAESRASTGLVTSDALALVILP